MSLVAAKLAYMRQCFCMMCRSFTCFVRGLHMVDDTIRENRSWSPRRRSPCWRPPCSSHPTRSTSSSPLPARPHPHLADEIASSSACAHCRFATFTPHHVISLDHQRDTLAVASLVTGSYTCHFVVSIGAKGGNASIAPSTLRLIIAMCIQRCAQPSQSAPRQARQKLLHSCR